MNKGINRIAAAVGALAIGLSCTGGATTDYPLLPFPRQETPVRLDDLFRGVEITPLETTEASLLSYPELLKTCRDTLFVFDRSNSSLLLFAPDGRFIRRIGRIGRGPGEYLRARDFLIDPDGRTVSLLNPIGEIITYGFDGGFIRRERLPEPPANYQHFERLDAKSLVTWSSEHRAQEGGVRIWTREGFALRNHFSPRRQPGRRLETAPYSTDTAIRSITTNRWTIASMRSRPTACAPPTHGIRSRRSNPDS